MFWIKKNQPPMTGNGWNPKIYTSYKHGEIGDGLLSFYQHDGNPVSKQQAERYHFAPYPWVSWHSWRHPWDFLPGQRGQIILQCHQTWLETYLYTVDFPLPRLIQRHAAIFSDIVDLTDVCLLITSYKTHIFTDCPHNWLAPYHRLFLSHCFVLGCLVFDGHEIITPEKNRRDELDHYLKIL